MPDNGIKFFARGGHKLADELEDRDRDPSTSSTAPVSPGNGPPGAGVGRVRAYDEGFDQYVAHLIGGAAEPSRRSARSSWTRHTARPPGSRPRRSPGPGAEVITIGADPDGLNINDGCGSTHLALLRAAVVEHGADLGIAHDGDADRCLAVDAAGDEVDGDQILAVLALAMREAGTLRGNAVVGTVMSNLGFKMAMEREGIELVQTAVGDRYVLESMKAARLRPRRRAVRAMSSSSTTRPPATAR